MELPHSNCLLQSRFQTKIIIVVLPSWGSANQLSNEPSVAGACWSITHRQATSSQLQLHPPNDRWQPVAVTGEFLGATGVPPELPTADPLDIGDKNGWNLSCKQLTFQPMTCLRKLKGWHDSNLFYAVLVLSDFPIAVCPQSPPEQATLGVNRRAQAPCHQHLTCHGANRYGCGQYLGTLANIP